MRTLKEIIADSRRMVFFGGAGVSTESNIPDFRSEEGIYQEKQYRYPPEIMLSHSFFQRHTQEFYDFYFDKMIYPSARPNPAHTALAQLEEQGKLTAVITQNIDGLHQMAGSRTVLELHGSVHRNYCMNCGKFHDLQAMLAQKGSVPRCSCGGIIKPDVVLYEEALDDSVVSEAIEHIRKADCLIVGGTSLAVYPAAALLHYFKGRELLLINKTATPQDNRATFLSREPIAQVLSQGIL